MLAANIAADLAAWTRLLGHDDQELRDANPPTLRYRVWHLPARLARHARQRILTISRDWPWTEAFLACWQPALRPARTRLTSTDSTIDTERRPPRRGRSRCHPGTPGAPPTPPHKNKTGIHLKTGAGTVSNQTSRCLND